MNFRVFKSAVYLTTTTSNLVAELFPVCHILCNAISSHVLRPIFLQDVAYYSPAPNSSSAPGSSKTM